MMKRIKSDFFTACWRPLFAVLGILMMALPGNAQYFGRNKPYYKKFRYSVYETPHFDIYYYMKNDSVLNQIARMSEEWYKRHYQAFQIDLEGHNPLFLYNNHADFQQTTAISGEIGVGTGGVTEALRKRIVFPVAPIYAQTDHVLGHEMVHAFQYTAILNGDSTNMNSLSNLPLWMVEGMAEYFSIGSHDPNTAMWMRDAVLHNEFPSFKDLNTDPKYFPYRWGQAFWAFVGKTWGDNMIVPLFMRTAVVGYEQAIKDVLGLDAGTVEGMWKSAYTLYYKEFLPDSIEDLTGEKVAFPGNAGDVNVSPSLSPDGKYLVFLSERDVISFDLFLADVARRKVVKRLSATVQHHEIDALNNLESAGSWSPDSRYFAFTVYDKGKNALVIVDVKKNKLSKKIYIPGVPAFYQPAWSPDGKSIVVVGLVQGQSDLYQYFFDTHEVRRITHDRYSYLQPCWSHDGRYLVTATDRTPQPTDEPWLHTNLALIDMQTQKVRVLPVFIGADNLNPLFSVEDTSIFFLSDRDGMRNLYRYDLESGSVWQLTRYEVGITGITKYSPAVSISRKNNELVYSYYSDNKYTIYKAAVNDFEAREVPADSLNFKAGILPPLRRLGMDIADRGRDHRQPLTEVEPENYLKKPYKPRFSLEYISNVQAGISTNSFARGMSGSVFAIFGDIAGTQQLFTSLALNGEIYDFGGQVTYVNQKNRLTWGVSASHIPYMSGTSYIKPDTVQVGDRYYLVDNLVYDIVRTFEDKLELYAYYPISTTQRLEAGVSQNFYYYRIDEWNNYYDPVYGNYMGGSRHKIPSPKGFNMQTVYAAAVLDNSINGLASPLRGARGRLEVEKYFGAYDFLSVTGDYRRYFYLRPVTLAARAIYTGRLATRGRAFQLYPLTPGYSWYMHGYDNYRLFDGMSAPQANFIMDQLYGNQMAVTNLELRIPFLGPKRLGLIKVKYFYTELVGFLDGSITWDKGDRISLDYSDFDPTNRVPLVSTGVSARINVMGYVVVEPFYAWPVINGELRHGYFGVHFLPGW
jgi:Tol biopolymer transport system component